jgi:dimethylamine monooxygenase subunit A
MPSAICQSSLPVAPWMDAMASRLPGLQPVASGDWLRRDDAFAGQMAHRDRLLADQRAATLIAPGGTEDAQSRLLAAVIDALRTDPAYRITPTAITRPDGAVIALDDASPLLVAAGLVQEDLLLLDRPDGAPEHILIAGAACFPASWTLAEKIGRPMSAIHTPVDRYDAGIAARVERVMQALRPGEPVWRANVLCYNDPDLHQPRHEFQNRPFNRDLPVWVRVERQTLLRLAPAGPVVFTIHTYLVPLDALTPEQRDTLPAAVRDGGSLSHRT